MTDEIITAHLTKYPTNADIETYMTHHLLILPTSQLSITLSSSLDNWHSDHYQAQHAMVQLRDALQRIHAAVRQTQENARDNEQFIEAIPTKPTPQSDIYRIERSQTHRALGIRYDYETVSRYLRITGFTNTHTPGYVEFDYGIIRVNVGKASSWTLIDSTIEESYASAVWARHVQNHFLRKIAEGFPHYRRIYHIPPCEPPAVPAPLAPPSAEPPPMPAWADGPYRCCLWFIEYGEPYRMTQAHCAELMAVPLRTFASHLRKARRGIKSA